MVVVYPRYAALLLPGIRMCPYRIDSHTHNHSVFWALAPARAEMHTILDDYKNEKQQSNTKI